ncbi:hypothetical protein ABZZ20_33780 [Streptomyces sp. NPDC006430]|uniref:hypothetical protein n=1 Tax=Streptomyces sp. NPDC006430 TaxID=3154299 RepID=UPI0033A411FF
MKRALLAAIVAAAVLAVAGCDNPFEDDPAPRTPDPATSAPKTPEPKNPGTKSPGRKVPVPDPKPESPKPVSPKPWVPKGPATLTGCGTFAQYSDCTFQGSNFKPGEKIYFLRDGSPLPDLTADKEGRFTHVTAGNLRIGAHTYTARGAQSGVMARTTVRVTPVYF